jgi:AcrR family transcriptional regulator
MNKNNGNTEGRIIDAAVQLFSRQGFSGTSTREIARLAEVNETSLFRYFPHKQDLFLRALELRLSRVRLRKELQAALIAGGKPETVVPLIIEMLVHTAVYESDLVRLLCVGIVELRPATEQLYSKHLAPVVSALTLYLEDCIRDGSLRPFEPSIVATAFASTVIAQLSLYPSLSGNCGPFSNAEEAIFAYSKFWLSALVPTAQIPSSVTAHPDEAQRFSRKLSSDSGESLPVVLTSRSATASSSGE